MSAVAAAGAAAAAAPTEEAVVAAVRSAAIKEPLKHALLRVMLASGLGTLKDVTAADPAAAGEEAAVYGFVCFSLLRETAAACEVDAAQRCIPLVALLAAHARRGGASPAAAAASSAAAAASLILQRH